MEAEQIALLEQKNKSLSSELDKVTGELFTANDRITDLQNQLAEKKHSEQLAAWAIDRAIESFKVAVNPNVSPAAVIGCAQTYCDWIKASSAQVVE